MNGRIVNHFPSIGQSNPLRPQLNSEKIISGTHKPVIAASNSVLASKRVSVAAAPQTNTSTAKSFSLKSYVKESGPAQRGVKIIHDATLRFGHGGIASVVGILKTGALEHARIERSNLRTCLSSLDPANPGILDKTVIAKGRLNCPISEIMEDLRLGTLGGDKRISSEEMKTYVAMGERICDAIKCSSDGQPPLTTKVDSKTITIPSNIDTARAISWYLLAKGIIDNANDPSRDPISVGNNGSMLIRDPGSKLYNFLNSAPNAYGRTSTHLKAHSENAGVQKSLIEAFKETGFISAFSVSKGGAVQRGIEDFTSKMPGGGTMLFDKLKPDGSGENLLFMKIEPVGTPTSFRFFGRHVDEADGFAQSVLALGRVAGRNIEHGIHLVESIAAKHFATEGDYRGEKFDKGRSKKIYADFCAALDNAKRLTPEQKDDFMTQIKVDGATGLKNVLESLEEAGLLSEPFESVQNELTTVMKSMGADLRIDRRGNEVHVTY